jgi:uncharacterized protein
MKTFRTLKLALAGLALTIAATTSAMNLQQAMAALGDAKAKGLVGEQTNGYLGVIGNDPQAAEIARLINEARRAEYQKLATENNIQLSDVEAIAGKKAIEKTEPGNYIRLDGPWQPKP